MCTANVYRDLQGCIGFFLQYQEKRAVGITGKPHILYVVHVVEKPNIYRLKGNLIVIIGISLQFVNITGFPYSW